MDDELRRIYLDEVMHRCEICHFAMKDLDEISKEDPMCRDPFRPASELIYHAAIVSKLLWPPRARDKRATERARVRGEQLRSLLNVTEDHPIRDRTLRDHFEHYDERLDAWAQDARNRFIARHFVGEIGQITASFVVQQYDPIRKTIAFLGQCFDIPALDSAVRDVYSRAKRARRPRPPPGG